jgi:hypothetical protein
MPKGDGKRDDLIGLNQKMESGFFRGFGSKPSKPKEKVKPQPDKDYGAGKFSWKGS